jgi:glucokinase
MPPRRDELLEADNGQCGYSCIVNRPGSTDVLHSFDRRRSNTGWWCLGHASGLLPRSAAVAPRSARDIVVDESGFSPVRQPLERMIEAEGRHEIAVDLGGTNLRVALVNPDGVVIRRHRVPTSGQGSITGALAELISELQVDQESSAVVAVPGLVDYESGRAVWAPHLPASWVAELAEDTLADRLGRPVSIANDADLAAVGETYFGAGRNAADVVYLTVSTGIGAGVLLNRRLVRGRRSVAEIGHTIIDRQAFLNDEPATLEELASGSSVPRLAQMAAVSAQSGEQLEVLEEVGDARASALWMEMVENVSIGIINIGWCFGPDLIIMGGGLGRERALFDPVRERMAKVAPTIAMSLSLVEAELGDDAGLVGAAAWHRAVDTPGR